jgi:hypothetical protein
LKRCIWRSRRCGENHPAFKRDLKAVTFNPQPGCLPAVAGYPSVHARELDPATVHDAVQAYVVLQRIDAGDVVVPGNGKPP